MGWSTDGFSYSQSQIGSTAYNAGCGNGYFWIHTGSPYMFIKGYINDGGAYSFTFYKPNSSHFGYYLKIYACGRLIFDLTASNLDNKSYSQVVTGTFSESEYNANKTLHAYCQANEGCVASLSMDGVNFYKAPSNISISVSSTTISSISFKSSWTKGSTGGNSATVYATTYSPQSISQIQQSNSGSTSISNGGTARIKNLKPNTKYYLTVYYDDQSGRNEGKISATTNTTTKKAVSDASISAYATGTTITVTPTWTNNGSSGCVAYISCNSVSKTSTGGNVIFTDLYNGTNYSIKMYVKDAEGNISNAPTLSIDTYEVNISSIESSTKAIKFSEYISSGKNTSKKLMYKISGGNAQNRNTVYNEDVIENNLDHDTRYTITAWIDDMTDEYGDLDTKITVIIYTKKLSVVNTSFKQYQHKIISTWQSKADGLNYELDNIIGDKIKFSLRNCINYGYKHEDDNINKFTYATPTNNGSVDGDYSLDKTLISSELDYWAWYKITCAITDGYNIVTSILDTNTTFPYSLIFIDGEYKKVMPYIYTNGKWINSTSYIYDTSWKESGTDA